VTENVLTMIHFYSNCKKSYGLGGAVADWFASYLSSRTQSVRSSSTMSAPSAVMYGVSQRSVLGPILYLL